MDVRALWAKSEPYHPLWKHMLDAAAVSLALPHPLESDGWSPGTLAWVVGMHDVGKADPAFQRMHEPFKAALEAAGFCLGFDAPVRHERVSASFLCRSILSASGDECLAESVAMAVAAHHGRWNAEARGSGPKFAAAQEALGALLSSALGLPAPHFACPADLSAFGMRLAGRVVLCDWIASNEAFFDRPELRAADDPAEYFTISRVVAREMVAKLQLNADEDAGRPERIVDQPRPLQQLLLDAPLAPGLVVIEAPMGEGKTEAAWILAEQWRQHAGRYAGVYMALPTQATGDAIFARYQDHYLRKLERAEKVHLVHGMAWLRDEGEPEKAFKTYGGADDKRHSQEDDNAFAAQWFRPTRRAMLAAHGAGTVDQFLVAGMNARFGFLRLYGLDRRVLVVDEVHAYDAYMTAILARGLAWCAAMRIPVVLLSATLSAGQRALLLAAYGARESDPGPDAPYPLITHVAFAGTVSTREPAAAAKRTLALQPSPGLLGDAVGTARLAERLAAEGKCVCVIVNTVRQAQRVYQELNLPAAEKGLFHARYTTARRQEIAEDVIAKFGKESASRPPRYVLVGTQVVEQSLDVDFDEMISEIAPIDLLLQRSGRIKRHARDARGRLKEDGADERGQPTLRILLPSDGELRFGGSEKVYARYVLLRTLALVSKPRVAELPGEFRTLIEAAYGEGAVPEGVIPPDDLARAKSDWQSEIAEMEGAAIPFLLNAPKARLFRPVRPNDPVGDDSDDGNGWRAKTRLGANDRTCLFVPERDLERMAKGVLPLCVVRDVYRDTVRLPGYVRLDEPAPGCGSAVEAKGALRGLMLIPCIGDHEWRGGGLHLRYDGDLGLTVEKA